MKIKFLGVPGEQLDAITMYGIEFERGEAVEVDEQRNAFAVRKLSAHPHFEAEGVEDAKIVGETRVDAGAVHAAQATKALAEFALDNGAAGQLERDAQAGRQVVDEPMADEAKRDAEAVNNPTMPEEGSDGEADRLAAMAEAHGVRLDNRWSIERRRAAVLAGLSVEARRA